jgi:hypothetical protein
MAVGKNAALKVTIIIALALIIVIAGYLYYNYTNPAKPGNSDASNQRYRIYFGNIRGNETSIKYGDFLFTFQPAVLVNVSSDFLEFKMKMTNMGNHTRTLSYGDPFIVFVYTKNGTLVSFMAKYNPTPLMLKGKDMQPGESFTTRWSVKFSSIEVMSPIPPGSYWVTAQMSGHIYPDPNDWPRDDYRVETPRIFMSISVIE